MSPRMCGTMQTEYSRAMDHNHLSPGNLSGKYPSLYIYTSIFLYISRLSIYLSIYINISVIYKAIFSVNVPMLFIYKFCKKFFFDPTTRRTLRTTPRWSSTKKGSSFIEKTKWPEGSIYIKYVELNSVFIPSNNNN